MQKTYRTDNFNYQLLPSLMDEAWPRSISERRSLRIETDDASLGSGNADDFNEMLRAARGPVKAFEAIIETDHKPNTDSMWGYEPGLSMRYRDGILEVHIGRKDPGELIEAFERLERLAGLTPATVEQRQPLRRTVFVAHAFDEVGKSYALELTRFLSLLGFSVSTGDAFSPESVSTKVKRRLARQEIVMAILSKASTWLLQESAGASFLEKPLFLILEEGIESPAGVLGDHEYIRFSSGHLGDSFLRILEGLAELGYVFVGGSENQRSPLLGYSPMPPRL